MMAALYEIDVRTINDHIQKIFKDGELTKESTIRNFRIVQTEGKRDVERNILHYNLQMVIAVGFKVDNERAIRFRKWAGQVVKDYTIYSFDCSKLIASLEEKFSGKWAILIRLHPVIANIAKYIIEKNENVMDATQYPDSQELILGANAFISDYSSMIFDAAMTNIPCFTYAKDYVEYKNSRGLYYNLEDLPFPLATTNEELMNNIKNFDSDSYHSKWDAFKKQMGLVETDSSAEKIADLVNDVIKNGKKVLVNYNFKT